MTKLYTALIKVQTELKNPDKNREGYGYKYADLASIINDTKVILKKHDLGVSQLVRSKGEMVGVETVLFHVSGEEIRSKIYLPITTQKNLSHAQAAGSTITYLRRYCLSAILGIAADEDTDAKEDTRKDTQTKPQESAERPPKDDLTATCKVHNNVMSQEWSTKKKKYYWTHKSPEGKYCFGDGYLTPNK